MNTKYFALFIILTTTANLDCIKRYQQRKKYFQSTMRSYEPYPRGPMIPESENFKNFWNEFYSNKNEDTYNTHGQTHITLLKGLGIIAISQLLFHCCFINIPTFKNNENYYTALTVAAAIHQTYPRLKDQYQTHKKIIERSAKKFSWKNLEILQKYYSVEENRNINSETFLKNVLNEKKKISNKEKQRKNSK